MCVATVRKYQNFVNLRAHVCGAWVLSINFLLLAHCMRIDRLPLLRGRS